MLNIYRNTEKKSTVAVIRDCETDALARIGKVMAARHGLGYNPNKCKRCQQVHLALHGVPNGKLAEMPKTIKATVTCDTRDTYSEAVGESEAVKKAMDNHKRAFLKALKRWQVAMIKDVMAVSPDTFKEALQEATQWK